MSILACVSPYTCVAKSKPTGFVVSCQLWPHFFCPNLGPSSANRGARIWLGGESGPARDAGWPDPGCRLAGSGGRQDRWGEDHPPPG